MLHWTGDTADQVRRIVVAGYPNEVCGILVGRDRETTRVVERVVEVANVWDDQAERTHRFLLDPRQQMRVEREAEAEGRLVIGFFHSHPDARPVPSAFDLEAAWPFYSYVIVAVDSRGITDMRSWMLEEEPARQFVEQSIA